MVPRSTTADTELQSRGALRLARPPESPPWLEAWVTTRGGGVSRGPWAELNLGRSVGDAPDRVAENERRLRLALELPEPRSWVRLRMEHGARVRIVSRPGLQGPGDGMITSSPRLLLALTVADCLPVVLWSPRRTVALLHAGWRGLAGGILEAAVATLCAVDGHGPEAVAAWLGPCIGPCCYTLAWSQAVQLGPLPPPTRPGPVAVDLRGVASRRLRRLGLRPGAITASALCTACRPDLFFSHRRDGPRTGRMLALARILP
jgi:hypothetical protein